MCHQCILYTLERMNYLKPSLLPHLDSLQILPLMPISLAFCLNFDISLQVLHNFSSAHIPNSFYRCPPHSSSCSYCLLLGRKHNTLFLLSVFSPEIAFAWKDSSSHDPLPLIFHVSKHVNFSERPLLSNLSEGNLSAQRRFSLSHFFTTLLVIDNYSISWSVC